MTAPSLVGFGLALARAGWLAGWCLGVLLLPWLLLRGALDES